MRKHILIALLCVMAVGLISCKTVGSGERLEATHETIAAQRTKYFVQDVERAFTRDFRALHERISDYAYGTTSYKDFF